MWKCRKCDLSIRSNSVPPVGNECDIMVIYEHPNYYENKFIDITHSNRTTRLRSLFNDIRIHESLVYITCAVKCKPITKLTEYQIHTCTDNYLNREFELVKPKLILVFNDETLEILNNQLNATLISSTKFQFTEDYAVLKLNGFEISQNIGVSTPKLDKQFKSILQFYKQYINNYHI